MKFKTLNNNVLFFSSFEEFCKKFAYKIKYYGTFQLIGEELIKLDVISPIMEEIEKVEYTKYSTWEECDIDYHYSLVIPQPENYISDGKNFLNKKSGKIYDSRGFEKDGIKYEDGLFFYPSFQFIKNGEIKEIKKYKKFFLTDEFIKNFDFKSIKSNKYLFRSDISKIFENEIKYEITNEKNEVDYFFNNSNLCRKFGVYNNRHYVSINTYNFLRKIEKLYEIKNKMYESTKERQIKLSHGGHTFIFNQKQLDINVCSNNPYGDNHSDWDWYFKKNKLIKNFNNGREISVKKIKEILPTFYEGNHYGFSREVKVKNDILYITEENKCDREWVGGDHILEKKYKIIKGKISKNNLII